MSHEEAPIDVLLDRNIIGRCSLLEMAGIGAQPPWLRRARWHCERMMPDVMSVFQMRPFHALASTLRFAVPADGVPVDVTYNLHARVLTPRRGGKLVDPTPAVAQCLVRVVDEVLASAREGDDPESYEAHAADVAARPVRGVYR